MNQQKVNFINGMANIGYILGSVLLYLAGLFIIASSTWTIFKDIVSPDFSIYNILDEVALIVFSIAVIDVGKYMMMEEVIMRSRDEKSPKEMRRTLTKLGIIIATALSIEGLILVIEVAKTNLTLIPYAVAVLLVATFYIIGLGIYQRLNATAEK